MQGKGGQNKKPVGRFGDLKLYFTFTSSSNYRMNQMFRVLSQPVNGVHPTGVVGFTPLFFTRAGRGGCVKPGGLVGFTQLVDAGLAVRKRVLRNWG